MNTLVSYDIQPAVPKGWHVFVYVDGEQVIIHGAFKTWDDPMGYAFGLRTGFVALGLTE